MTATTKAKRVVPLKDPRHDFSNDKRVTQTAYVEAAPFFENPRGVLIHRVRSLFRMKVTWNDEPWWIVEYWCENSGRTDAVDSGLLFDPGVKFVCARCEANAVAAKMRTSSEVAGRHVCVGGVRAVNLCVAHGDPAATEIGFE